MKTRDINLRAYDEISKVMHYDVSIVHRIGNPMLVRSVDFQNGVIDVEFLTDCRVGEVMLWAGLQDCNSIDIYEEDILELAQGRHCRVVYREGGLGFIKKSGFIGFSGHQHLRKILSYAKVIGNTFENPEIVYEVEE